MRLPSDFAPSGGRSGKTGLKSGPRERRRRLRQSERRPMERRVLSRKRVIGLFRSLVLTFDSREKVLDRTVARSVPGLFGLAQVGSSGPPAQLSTDLPG
jgi:hypothetical protein